MEKTEGQREPDTSENELKLRQEKFCQLFASDAEFFGNGVQSYIEAYNIDTSKKGAYAGARASASILLTKPNILARINELLESAVLNDEFVDKQLSFLISQNADFSSKIAAIREYNALKKRITKKIEVEDHRQTEEKIKEFLDEPTDYGTGESNATSTEPATAPTGDGGSEVATTTPPVS